MLQPQKKPADIPEHSKPSEKILNDDHRGMQIISEAHICQSWKDVECNMSRSIQKSQITYKRGNMHEILQFQEANISGNGCIKIRYGCWPTAGKRWLKLWIWWSTRQCNVLDYCACPQDPIQCRAMIQQCRKRSTQNSAWVQEGPWIVLCIWSTYHYKPQATGGDNG